MLENMNEIAVLVSAILAMAVGSIWYSPLLFGDHWVRASGLSWESVEASKNSMAKLLGYGFITNLALMIVLAQFVSYAQSLTLSIAAMALALSVFLLAVMANAVIWEQKPIAYLLIHVGYATVVIFGGMIVLSYWPW